MEKVRKKLVREKAVIAVYQYLLTDSTTEELETYLNNFYKPRMDAREVAACKKMVFETIERIDEFKTKIEPNLKKGWTMERLSYMEAAILYVAVYELDEMSKEIVAHEAVELTKKYCDDKSYKFINGVIASID